MFVKRFILGGLMHAVIRRYRVRLGTMEQAARYAEKWFLPLLRDISGFNACYLVAEEGILVSVGLFETAEAANAAIKLAHEWFREEWGAFRTVPPEVIAGEVLVQAVANGHSITDRRRRADRRSVAVLMGREAEQRNGGDRRRGIDRRVHAAPLIEWRAAG